MGKFEKIIEKHFKEDSFSPYDFSNVSGISSKVCSMVLKRMHTCHKIGGFITEPGTSMYFYRTKEKINEARKKENEIIDKYNLKNKKWKML